MATKAKYFLFMTAAIFALAGLGSFLGWEAVLLYRRYAPEPAWWPWLAFLILVGSAGALGWSALCLLVAGRIYMPGSEESVSPIRRITSLDLQIGDAASEFLWEKSSTDRSDTTDHNPASGSDA